MGIYEDNDSMNSLASQILNSTSWLCIHRTAESVTYFMVSWVSVKIPDWSVNQIRCKNQCLLLCEWSVVWVWILLQTGAYCTLWLCCSSAFSWWLVVAGELCLCASMPVHVGHTSVSVTHSWMKVRMMLWSPEVRLHLSPVHAVFSHVVPWCMVVELKMVWFMFYSVMFFSQKVIPFSDMNRHQLIYETLMSHFLWTPQHHMEKSCCHNLIQTQMSCLRAESAGRMEMPGMDMGRSAMVL